MAEHPASCCCIAATHIAVAAEVGSLCHTIKAPSSQSCIELLAPEYETVGTRIALKATKVTMLPVNGLQEHCELLLRWMPDPA